MPPLLLLEVVGFLCVYVFKNPLAFQVSFFDSIHFFSCLRRDCLSINPRSFVRSVLQSQPLLPLSPSHLDTGFNQVRAPAAPYGYTADNGAIRTPNVQRLAEEGLTFMSWYSSFHVCSPCKSSSGHKRTRLLSFASRNGRKRYRPWRGRSCGRKPCNKSIAAP